MWVFHKFLSIGLASLFPLRYDSLLTKISRKTEAEQRQVFDKGKVAAERG